MNGKYFFDVGDIKRFDLDDLIKKYMCKSYSYALINHLINNYGALELKIDKIEDKPFVVARLRRKTNVYNEESIEAESNIPSTIEDAVVDAICRIFERIGQRR